MWSEIEWERGDKHYSSILPYLTIFNNISYYPHKSNPHSNCIFKFPAFSLSNCKFSLCQFTWFLTITYTKLTWQTYPLSKQFSQEIWRYPLPLESGNLQLEQTKFPVLAKISCVFLDRDLPFSPFFVQWVPWGFFWSLFGYFKQCLSAVLHVAGKRDSPGWGLGVDLSVHLGPHGVVIVLLQQQLACLLVQRRLRVRHD